MKNVIPKIIRILERTSLCRDTKPVGFFQIKSKRPKRLFFHREFSGRATRVSWQKYIIANHVVNDLTGYQRVH